LKEDFMLKHFVLAASLTCATAAYAQPQQATGPPPPGAAISPLPAPAATADTRKLIGRKIQDAQNETIGQITSIYIGPDGHVDSVLVGVGGFLGLGEREVKIAWSDLHVENYGEKVMVNMTRDELKAKPEYKYNDTSWRGQVFSDKGPWPAADPNRSASATDRMPNNGVAIGGKPASDRNMAAATTSAGDFNAAGEMWAPPSSAQPSKTRITRRWARSRTSMSTAAGSSRRSWSRSAASLAWVRRMSW
jgi:hypothetical protein